MKNNNIVKMLFGSHLYGLDTKDSDFDYKGIVIPSKKQIIAQEANFGISKSTGKQNSKNTNEDIDEEYFSLMKFVKLACKGETVALDMLHASNDKILEGSDIWNELVSLRSKFYTKNMKAYVGYVRKQAAKYSIKGSKLNALESVIDLIRSRKDISLPLGSISSQLIIGEHSKFIENEHPRTGKQYFYEICGRKFQLTNRLDYTLEQLQKIYDAYGHRAQLAKENKNIDWKAISHALRAGFQSLHTYEDGGFSYPLPETKFLLDVKQGNLDWLSEVQPVLDKLVEDVDKAAMNSVYPDEVDMEFWNQWLYNKHIGIVLNDE